MIDRLNFFDLYGYLVPGLVLVLIVYLPYALLNPQILSIELGSGLVAIVVGYVIGYQLYGLAELTLLSKMKIEGRWQHYSAFILYDHDPTNAFPPELRKTLRDAIREYFLGPQAANGPTATDVVRELIEHRYFIPARTALLHNRRGGYAEQFQGMYVMARGISLACGLGAIYLLGWLTLGVPAAWRAELPRTALALAAATFAVGALGGAAVLWWAKRQTYPAPRWLERVLRLPNALDRETLERRAAWWVVGALCAFALSVAIWRAQPEAKEGVAAPLAVGLFACVLIALRSYAAFRHFALLFAKTVYTDFFVMVRDAERSRKAASNRDD